MEPETYLSIAGLSVLVRLSQLLMQYMQLEMMLEMIAHLHWMK
jgi:hypothetical protein